MGPGRSGLERSSESPHRRGGRARNPPPVDEIESSVIPVVQWLKLCIEVFSAAIIALGVGLAAAQFLRALLPPRVEGFTQIRLTMARFLALALEFQLGADILGTAIAPTWDQIGKLGAIAVIRTMLNFFLMREMEAERPDGPARTPPRQSEDNA